MIVRYDKTACDGRDGLFQHLSGNVCIPIRIFFHLAYTLMSVSEILFVKLNCGLSKLSIKYAYFVLISCLF